MAAKKEKIDKWVAEWKKNNTENANDGEVENEGGEEEKEKCGFFASAFIGCIMGNVVRVSESPICT